MKTIKYDKEILNCVIPYMRNNEDLVYLLKIIGERFLKLQKVIEYLLSSYNIRMAKGQFLDFAGMEVDATRDEADMDSFICVNSPDINVEKRFYFLSSGLNPIQIISLSDNEYLSKILAKISMNMAQPNIMNVIDIVKAVTNADDVLVIPDDNASLKIIITGEQLFLTANTVNYIKQFILGNGIYLKEVKVNE